MPQLLRPAGVVPRGWLFYAKVVVTSLGLILFGFVGWTGLGLWNAWRSIERIDFALDEARIALPPPTLAPETPAAPDAPAAPVWDPPDEAFTAYLLVGSDESVDKAIASADSITLFLDPDDTNTPILVSLPRDLLVLSPCTGEPDRLAESLGGCSGIAGPEVLALAVEGYTGIVVDHFAVFGFDGFVRVVDELGGLELCVEHDFRSGSGLEPMLQAGCQIADGTVALAWVRSRVYHEELINGQWVAGVGGDAARRERQQLFLLAVLRELGEFNSVGQLTDLAGDLADTFALDDGLSLLAAVSRVWDLRSLAPSQVIRPVIQTIPSAAPSGAFAVVPVATFAEVLVEAYPAASALYR